MATVINNPNGEGTSSSPVTAIVIGVIVLAIIALVIFYGLPMLQGIGTQQGNGIDVNVKLPENGGQDNGGDNPAP